MANPSELRRTLPIWGVFAELIGLVGITLLGVFLGKTYGFDWSKTSFSYHPLFMVLGLVFLNGQAMILYRVFPHAPKLIVKSIHGVLEFTVIVCVTVGLIAKVSMSGWDIDCVHAWLGILTLTALLLQFVMALSVFTCASLPMRAWFMPIHRWLGVSVLALGTGTAMVGLNLLESSNLTNCAALFLVLFAMLIGYIATYSGFERPKEPEAVGEFTPLN